MASVQYGGEIDLAPFQCTDISQGSRISRVCYDAENKYLLIRVGQTYHQFCEIEAGTATRFLASPSLDHFFESIIEDSHGCRPENVPKYDKAPTAQLLPSSIPAHAESQEAALLPEHSKENGVVVVVLSAQDALYLPTPARCEPHDSVVFSLLPDTDPLAFESYKHVLGQALAYPTAKSALADARQFDEPVTVVVKCDRPANKPAPVHNSKTLEARMEPGP